MGIRRRRKYWGWGYEDEALSAAERDRLDRLFREMLGLRPDPLPAPTPVAELDLPAPRLDVEDGPGCDLSASPYDRIVHAAGKSFRDLIRMRRGPLPAVPDAVLYPETPEAVVEALAWAEDRRLAVIPFGGGSSVTGGVEPVVSSRFGGAVSLDVTRMARVLEVDDVSRLVRAEAGIFGPDLDATLKPHGLTIRHYPQSYYFSTLGGWIATRAGGHYSNLFGKIDERVAALELATPSDGLSATRRLPQGSVGPDPNRLWVGSEGTLGVITSAWVRVVADPRHRLSAAVELPGMPAALDASRAIVQSGLEPAQLRVLDPWERLVSSMLTGGRPGEAGTALMIIAFESSGHPVKTQLDDALRIARRHGGIPLDGAGGDGDAAHEGWRQTFFRQPYVRDLMLDWGLVVDTFETAIPWQQAEGFYHRVREVTMAAVESACGTGGVLCRTTHTYRDGVAFYFTFFGPAHRGRELAQWTEIKTAATDAVIEGGGTASHHHAAGRDHAPWADRELPAAWRRAFTGAKAALDPGGILNPGAIFPER